MQKFFECIHPEGWRFFGIFAAFTFLLYFISLPLFWVGIVLTLWCAYFFRDPKRVTPTDPNLVVSPADGKVVIVKKMVPPSELDLGNEELYRISIFLNVFDVHINRVPVAGLISRILYYPGKFFNASLDKASEHNERNAVVIETEKGQKVCVIQIAGLIARRIVTFVKQEDKMKPGQRFGLIRFGSRADVYLPRGVTPKVMVGQYMIGGESILANLDDIDAALPNGIEQ